MPRLYVRDEAIEIGEIPTVSAPVDQSSRELSLRAACAEKHEYRLLLVGLVRPVRTPALLVGR